MSLKATKKKYYALAIAGVILFYVLLRNMFIKRIKRT